MSGPAPQTVVMKFGGTSVADAERIKRAASRIAQAADEGARVVAVLSARGKTTDELVSMAYEVSERPHPREMDMLLSTGERISCALAAMVINDLGHEAISLTGSQAGIVTDTSHTKARILDVRADRISAALDEGKVVLVAGFQGVSTTSDVTTLGRGGSDTTAVALAAALGADVCEIYTDVAGVFSADPRIVPDARKLSVVSFEEMLEMAASGAGVLQLRSVEYARNHGIPIHCRSSFDDGPGTFVQPEELTMERPLVTAVTHSTDEARVTLTDLPDRPGIAGRVLSVLAEGNVNVDMIIQNEPESEGQSADMSFTVPRDDLVVAIEALEAVREELGIGAVASDSSMGKVSIVGAGMKSHPGVAAKTFSVLGEAGVNIEMISTSPIKISCVIREEHVERAVRELHAAFDLGEGGVHREDVSRHPPAGGLLSMRVAVVGATGAVGSTILGVMRERGFPADEVVPLASARSAGRRIDWGEQTLTVQELTEDAVRGFDLALFSAGRHDQRRVGPALRRRRRGGGGQLLLLAHARRRAAGGGRGQRRRAWRATRASWPTRTAPRCRR